jgi:hypothetical protein
VAVREQPTTTASGTTTTTGTQPGALVAVTAPRTAPTTMATMAPTLRCQSAGRRPMAKAARTPVRVLVR